MSTIVLLDTFSGSTGTMAGRAPTTSLSPGVTWATESGTVSEVNGGYAACPSPTDTNTFSQVSIGVDGVDYNNDPPVEVTVTFVTPPNLGYLGNVWHGGSRVAVYCGGLETSGKVFGYYSASVMKWWAQLQLRTSIIDESTYVELTSELSPSTEYTGVIRIADGAQKFTFLGHELTNTKSFPNSTGFNKVNLQIGGYSKLGDISVAILTETATLDATLPSLQLASGFGASADFSFPSIIGGIGVLSLDATLPGITLDATGHNSTGENDLSFSLPSLLIESNSGAQINASLSPISFDFGMTGTALITVDVSLPTIDLDSGGLGSPYIVSADFELPRITSEADFGAYADIAFSSITVEASVTSGGVVSLDVTIPAVTLDCAGTATSYGSIVFTLPAIVPCAGITADFSIPSFSLDSYVSATITATYEAYAVNLNHQRGVTNQEIPINETTRYTNFPFTHVVRYMNSYYGANSTGLYLLEGTTDAGTAIPFDVKTAMTDFKSPTKKTVESAYFSGRFGPASTITLTAGEDTPKTYSYSTPRDQNAQNHRQTFGKGLKERYYSLELAGTGALELDGIEMNVKNLSRRI